MMNDIKRDRSTGLWKLGSRVIRLECIAQFIPVKDIADKPAYRIMWTTGEIDTVKKNDETDALYAQLLSACLNRDADVNKAAAADQIALAGATK